MTAVFRELSGQTLLAEGKTQASAPLLSVVATPFSSGVLSSAIASATADALRAQGDLSAVALAKAEALGWRELRRRGRRQGER